jgi:hypothetical protein
LAPRQFLIAGFMVHFLMLDLLSTLVVVGGLVAIL